MNKEEITSNEENSNVFESDWLDIGILIISFIVFVGLIIFAIGYFSSYIEIRKEIIAHSEEYTKYDYCTDVNGNYYCKNY